MAERKRNKEIHFYVTEEERKLIRRKMIESKTKNMGAYLRKMAIDGYIVNTDTTPLKKQYEEMHKIGVNINQIVSTYVTTGNREGFERWAKLNNLKEAARTFNYLSENNLLNYENFQQHISDVANSVKIADQRIEEISAELGTQKLIQKYCDSYRLCRKVIEDCKFAQNPKL